MSWRVVVVTGVAKLDLKMGFLVVRKETTTKIHISEIHTLIVDSTAVSLTAALLNELIHRKVKVIFCDETHNPASELIPCRGSHDSSLKVKMQINWSPIIKEQVWTEIIAEKIRKQEQLLSDYERWEEAALLRGYLCQLQPGDQTNREGHAAIGLRGSGCGIFAHQTGGSCGGARVFVRRSILRTVPRFCNAGIACAVYRWGCLPDGRGRKAAAY